MGQQPDPRKTSRSQNDENDIGQRLSCQQLERRFQELLRLREKVRVAECGRLSSKVQNSAWN
jgi:hypothetical protein